MIPSVKVVRTTLAEIREAVEQEGFEVYRSTAQELFIAERVRFHLMDAGVRVRLPLRVLFVARAQQSDFPSKPVEYLLNEVRTQVGSSAVSRGYSEVGYEPRHIKNPGDLTRTLDTWHEVTFEKHLSSSSELAAELKWAIEIEKCVVVPD